MKPCCVDNCSECNPVPFRWGLEEERRVPSSQKSFGDCMVHMVHVVHICHFLSRCWGHYPCQYPLSLKDTSQRTHHSVCCISFMCFLDLNMTFVVLSYCLHRGLLFFRQCTWFEGSNIAWKHLCHRMFISSRVIHVIHVLLCFHHCSSSDFQAKTRSTAKARGWAKRAHSITGLEREQRCHVDADFKEI